MNQIIIIIALVFVGWTAGALVNYIADILPLRRRLTAPFCIYCQAQYSLINYFFWPRRCASCGRGRTWRVWLVELMYTIFSLLIWYSPPEPLGYWAGLLLLIYLGVVVVIDLEYRLIMHPVSLVGIVLGVYVGVTINGIIDTVVGGLVGFGVMLSLYVLGDRVIRWISKHRGQKTEEVALGFGDVNLSGVLGLMLGWPAILVGLMGAVLLGGIVSLIYLIIMLVLRRYRLFSALPYGPFLVAGAILIIYFREEMVAIFGG